MNHKKGQGKDGNNGKDNNKKFVPNSKWKSPELGKHNKLTIDGKPRFFNWDAKH
jgi:hypothetical protein